MVTHKSRVPIDGKIMLEYSTEKTTVGWPSS